MNAVKLFLVLIIIVIAIQLCAIVKTQTVPAMEKRNSQIENIINELEK